MVLSFLCFDCVCEFDPAAVLSFLCFDRVCEGPLGVVLEFVVDAPAKRRGHIGVVVRVLGKERAESRGGRQRNA